MKHERMIVDVRGTIYQSADEASQALGVKRVTIYSAISRGSIHTVGLGPGNHKRVPGKGGGRPKKFDIGGLSYPTMRAASVDLGFSPSYTGQALRLKRKSSLEKVLAAAMKRRAEEENKARLEAIGRGL